MQLSKEFSTFGKVISLDELLQARDNRANLQEELRLKHNQTVLSVTVSAMGAVKKNALFDFIFAKCLIKLTACFAQLGITPTEQIIQELDTGHEALFSLPIEATRLKQAMINLEDETPLARLWDLDVISSQGELLSRSVMGFLPRSCLICSNEAKICARERRHSLDEMLHQIQQRAKNEYASERVANLVHQALLQEVHLTPKAGLVDCNNHGAHQDMNLATFKASCQALSPFWAKFFHIGINTANQPASQILAQIRPLGMQAESEMFLATNAVNTHKGAIFAFGIICTVLGRLWALQKWHKDQLVEQLCENVAEICQGICKELQHYAENTPLTHGIKMYKTYGLTGARGEAEKGFPLVKAIMQKIDAKPNWHKVLLQLMAENQDTNLVHRGGLKGLQFVQERAQTILKQYQQIEDMDKFEQALYQFDQECIQRNLSAGGSADLLAVVMFLDLLKKA